LNGSADGADVPFTTRKSATDVFRLLDYFLAHDRSPAVKKASINTGDPSMIHFPELIFAHGRMCLSERPVNTSIALSVTPWGDAFRDFIPVYEGTCSAPARRGFALL